MPRFQISKINTSWFRIVLIVLLGLGSLLSPTWQALHAQDAAQIDLPHITLKAGMFQIDAQVAATPQQRSIGLMWRQSMPQHEGMLFAFEQAGVQCFWMKNTSLALTAAFVSDDGKIVNLADMKPLSEQSHCSKQPVRYVLEMNQGWFKKKGLKAGDPLSGPVFNPLAGK